MRNFKQIVRLITLCSLLLSSAVFAEGLDIIPVPAHIERGEGTFTIDAETSIVTTSQTEHIGRYLSELLSGPAGFKLPVTDTLGKGKIIYLLDAANSSNLGEEGYRMTVSDNSILITATKPAGVFYGVQTLRQMLPTDVESDEPVEGLELTVAQVTIEDKPRFEWRGSLLDCCRHYFEPEFVKRYIDLLAMHKMNVLHWHLTEDQGWRIEIKKYPKLTEVGAWRKTWAGPLGSPKTPLGRDGKLYGGFYTQDQVRDIVAYAKSRYVTVVPEIEMPGHSHAALAAYPELSCTGGPFEVSTKRGIDKDVYCAGNEKTFEFLENVLTEVVELFDAPYVHIGGDECPKARWSECPKCQQRIKDEGLADEHELQSYFIRRMEKFLNSKGKAIIGWDEILEGGLAPNATVQSWRGMEGAIAAARAGHDVIVSPTSHCYLDYPHKNTSLQQSYSFEPVPEQLTAEQAKHVLGGEGNVWTEHIMPDTIDSWVFPRLTALAEVFWSPKQSRDFGGFQRRLESHYQRLDKLGVDHGREKEKRQ